MILTISPNCAVDRILFVDEIIPATTMRCSAMIDHIGGKGLDTSIALNCMGVETFGLGFAAGVNGRIMADALVALAVPHELIWLEGETRIAHVIVETARHRHSHIIPARSTPRRPMAMRCSRACATTCPLQNGLWAAVRCHLGCLQAIRRRFRPLPGRPACQRSLT